MELSPREESILSGVIDFYISSGEPVGSKLLSAVLPFAVSSATIRNETAFLSELGFLEQPHTSAGRVPTERGYRYYVDRLMPGLSPTDGDRFRILSGIDHSEGDAARLLTDACGVLSEMTGCMAFALTPASRDAVISNIQAIPLGTHSALVTVDTSAGMLKTRIARLPAKLDYPLLELFYNVTAANLLNTPAEALTVAKLQTLVASLGSGALAVAPLLVCMFDATREAADGRVLVSGQHLLLKVPELKNNAPAIIEQIGSTEFLTRLLLKNDGDTLIRIGSETGVTCMEGASVLGSAYKTGDDPAGVIGIVGAARMDYAHLLPLVKYTSTVVGKLIGDNCKSR